MSQYVIMTSSRKLSLLYQLSQRENINLLKIIISHYNRLKQRSSPKRILGINQRGNKLLRFCLEKKTYLLHQNQEGRLMTLYLLNAGLLYHHPQVKVMSRLDLGKIETKIKKTTNTQPIISLSQTNIQMKLIVFQFTEADA